MAAVMGRDAAVVGPVVVPVVVGPAATIQGQTASRAITVKRARTGLADSFRAGERAAW